MFLDVDALGGGSSRLPAFASLAENSLHLRFVSLFSKLQVFAIS